MTVNKIKRILKEAVAASSEALYDENPQSGYEQKTGVQTTQSRRSVANSGTCDLPSTAYEVEGNFSIFPAGLLKSNLFHQKKGFTTEVTFLRGGRLLGRQFFTQTKVPRPNRRRLRRNMQYTLLSERRPW